MGIALTTSTEWQGNVETLDVANFSDSEEDLDDDPRALGTHETFVESVAQPIKRSIPTLSQAKLAKKPMNKTPGLKGSVGTVRRHVGNRPNSKSLFVERDNNAKAAYRRRQPHTGEPNRSHLLFGSHLTSIYRLVQTT